LALDSVVMGHLSLGEGLLPPPSCEPTAVGFEELWSLTLSEPATITLEVGGMLDTVLFVRGSCGAATDLACNDDLSEYVFVSSVTLPLPRGTWFVGVKEWGNDGTGGPYSLSASTGGAGSCEFPTRLQPGLVTARDTRSGVGGPSTACLPSEGGESYFLLEVPPGQRGTLTVTPTGTAIDLTTRVRAACADGACVASGHGASPQQLVFGNPGPGSQSFIASVASTGQGPGTFEVLAALWPLVSSGYTESVLTAGCDDFSTEAAVLGATTGPPLDDDSSSAVLPLPAGFAFTYFGVPMSHFSVSSNGFAQLYPGATGVPSSAYLSASMPSAAPPNGLLAPLWGDLVGAGVESAVRARTTGVAPDRVFGLEWSDFAFGLAGVISPERLRFQLRLFETSNVIEFHYCSMALNGGSLARLTGQTVAVGLESNSGAEAVQHSYRMPQSVQAETALRFTPK
jgi:hypothetical protein